jgi:murein DD-endopeptidase MepM/ murein hydrolase activator NlpD
VKNLHFFEGALSFLVVVLFVSGIAFAVTEQDLSKVQEELKSERLKLKEAREKESRALSGLYKVNKELKEAKQDLAVTKIRITEGGKRITALSSELKDLEAALKGRSRLLSLRINEAYKSGGGFSFLEVLFSSTSISDFINKGYYLERIISSDLSLIAEIRGRAKSIGETKSQLRSAIDDMNTLALNIKRRKGQIESNADAKKRLYESLRERREEYEKRVAELEKSSKQFEGLIRRASDERARERKGEPRGSGRMIWPAPGRVVSGFGYRRDPIWGGIHLHTGVDIAAAFGEPVRAADAGEVIFSGWWDGYGKAVVIDHGRLVSTIYGHMSRIYVEAGQHIDKAQIVGLVGTTGFSTGPHLHFEVRKNGTPVNPMPYLM